MNCIHVASLLGRVFLISSFHTAKEWRGITEIDEVSDYDAVRDVLEYEEAGLSLFSKSKENSYLLYYSMSSKVEVFQIKNSIILCEGLYFNKSWDYSLPMNVVIDETNLFKIEVSGKYIVIVDAAEDLSVLTVPSIDNNELHSFCSVPVDDGIYEASKVSVEIAVNNETIILQGVMLVG
ncbi:MAG: hypothetical protein DI539_24250 [Flavobacterium psychrophilum]|nr:MAG: hypothetical protein DI539_24250 [Flavobacterium psychrophilum]